MSRRIVLNKPTPARTALGIEDYEIEGALTPTEELESAVQMSELSSAAADDLDTADTLAFRAEALEDLVTVAETTPEASENDLVLTEIVADLATQGTDLTTDGNVVPALESYVGKSIAVEGIKETIESMWKALMDFLKNSWQNVKAFFGNVDAQVATLKKKLREAAQRASDSTVTEAKTQSKGLCVGGKGPSSPEDLLSNLTETKSVLDKLLNGYATVVAREAKNVSKWYKRNSMTLSVSDSNGENTQLASDEVEKSLDAVLESAKPFNNSTLLGNISLALEYDSTDRSNKTFRFEAETVEGFAGASSFEIDVEAKKRAFDGCLALIDLIENFRTKKLLDFEMETVPLKLLPASMTGPDTARTLNALGRTTRQLSRLTQSPFVKVVSTTLASVRAHIAALDVEGKGKEVATA